MQGREMLLHGGQDRIQSLEREVRARRKSFNKPQLVSALRLVYQSARYSAVFSVVSSLPLQHRGLRQAQLSQ